MYEEPVGAPAVPQGFARLVTINNQEYASDDMVFGNEERVESGEFSVERSGAEGLHKVIVHVGTGIASGDDMGGG